MCGFGVTNRIGLEKVNKYCQRRGPDLTNSKIINSVEFLHNLLHITGDITPQPFNKNDIACVFNGEIYNFKSFGSYSSDGECLIDLYTIHGEEFTKFLDGEFALCLVDFSKNKIIISVDTFSCKPLWYDFDSTQFCIASYNSQLIGLNFKNGKKLQSNTTEIYDLKNLKLKSKFKNKSFDLRQHKNSFDDWIESFRNSIKKRTQNTPHKMFCGMSSGYDSGAIAFELQKQNANFKSYTILNNENDEILKSRLKIIKSSDSFLLTSDEFQKWKAEINQNCEDFSYKGYSIKGDQASMGLSAICNRARSEGRRIYFSGQGADEIISDYGFGGRKIYKHSGFGGLFPENLEGFFPWHSFYDGTQIQYLNKEEYVAGHFGIETRYPFLDNELVQEFLWLSPKLKNSKYKSCLDEYLRVNNFPYEHGGKRGFHVTEKGGKAKKL
jgi:asparagine synthetase B (glutamine-hydrolysing)